MSQLVIKSWHYGIILMVDRVDKIEIEESKLYK
jgi:hypothetical protein